MTRLILSLVLITCVVAGSPSVLAQGSAASSADDVKALKQKVELLQREVKLLEKEIDLLKREMALLKTGSAANKTPTDKGKAVPKTTVDDVEYEYGGVQRLPMSTIVTIYAKSSNGTKHPPAGMLSLVDEDGNEYSCVARHGTLLSNFMLKEGVRSKLWWEGKRLPNTVKEVSLSINRAILAPDATPIEFKKVPLTVPTDRGTKKP